MEKFNCKSCGNSEKVSARSIRRHGRPKRCTRCGSAWTNDAEIREFIGAMIGFPRPRS